MASTSLANVAPNENPPPSALWAASARSPLPLAPRLTTTTSPRTTTLQRESSSGARRDGDEPVSSRIARVNLLHRSSQPLATQALSTEPTPSAGRFTAYLPPRPRVSLAHTLTNATRLPHRSVSPTQEAAGSRDGGNEASMNDTCRPYGQLDSVNNRGSAAMKHAHRQETAKINLLPQFQAGSEYRGDVVVRCGSHDFYVHKAVLYFTSPFFQSIFDGDWKETHLSVHSVSCSSSTAGATDDEEEDAEGTSRDSDGRQSPSYNDDASRHDDGSEGEDEIGGLASSSSRRASYCTAPVALEHRESLRSSDSEESGASTPIMLDIMSSDAGRAVATIHEDRQSDLTPPRSELESGQESSATADGRSPAALIERLERLATPPLPDSKYEAVPSAAGVSRSPPVQPKEGKKEAPLKSPRDEKEVVRTRPSVRKDELRDVTAIVDLSEEDPSTFQDVLCHVYPNLELQVTWLNTPSLFSFADKFAVPHLRRACTTFLRAALAGRPIEAMALSELYGIEDVYREASRHILDNMPSWDPDDLALLSQETLLKLERKRTWFLERLLKLGLAQPARDYECHTKCSDPQACANSLHERWHAQYAAAFKYGPPQPSIVWRHLRELETASGMSGASGTATLACQASSKAWAQNLFDRMYGLPSHQHTGRASQKFLAIKLAHQEPHRPRARRVNTADALRLMSTTR